MCVKQISDSQQGQQLKQLDHLMDGSNSIFNPLRSRVIH